MSLRPTYDELAQRVKELEKREKKYSKLFHLSPVCTAFLDLDDGYFLEVNDFLQI